MSKCNDRPDRHKSSNDTKLCKQDVFISFSVLSFSSSLTFLKHENVSYTCVNGETFRSGGFIEQKQDFLLLGTFIWTTKLSASSSDLEHGLL